jgi:hypothetical protein
MMEFKLYNDAIVKYYELKTDIFTKINTEGINNVVVFHNTFISKEPTYSRIHWSIAFSKNSMEIIQSHYKIIASVYTMACIALASKEIINRPNISLNHQFFINALKIDRKFSYHIQPIISLIKDFNNNISNEIRE